MIMKKNFYLKKVKFLKLFFAFCFLLFAFLAYDVSFADHNLCHSQCEVSSGAGSCMICGMGGDCARVACNGDSDCLAGQTCENGNTCSAQCVGGPPPPGCSYACCGDSDCSGGQTCVNASTASSYCDDGTPAVYFCNGTACNLAPDGYTGASYTASDCNNSCGSGGDSYYSCQNGCQADPGCSSGGAGCYTNDNTCGNSCEGGGGGESNGSFSILVSPLSQIVTINSAYAYSIRISSVNHWAGTVNISRFGTPPGGSFTWNWSNVNNGCDSYFGGFSTPTDPILQLCDGGWADFSWSGSSGPSAQPYTITFTGVSGIASVNQDVALNVTAPPAHIVLNPSSFTFNGESGGATPAGQTMSIGNTGGSDLTWSSGGVTGKPGIWCYVSPSSGSVGPGLSADVIITVDAPTAVGSFTDCGIRITDSNADNSPQDVSLTYNVTTGPVDGGPGGNTFNIGPATCPVTGVVLTWTAGGGANSYNVYRASHGGAPVLLAGNIGNVLTYTDTTGAAATAYDYWVESLSMPGGSTGPQVPASTNSGSGIAKNICVSPPNPPDGVGGSNYLTPPVGTIPCGRVQIYFTDRSDNEDGFRLFRNIADDFSTATQVGADIISTTVAGTGTVYNTPINSPPVSGTIYYYWAVAYNIGGSVVSSAFQFADIPCSANLSGSDKDLVGVNSLVFSPAPTQCGSTNPLPAGTTLTLGDSVSFQINLCNDSGSATATNITITDTLLSVTRPSTGWNMKYNGVALTERACGQSLSSGEFLACGTSPNEVLTINVTAGSNNVSAGGRKILTFSGILTPSSSATGNAARMQNSFVINYNAGSVSGATPPFLFYIGGGGPTIDEIAP